MGDRKKKKHNKKGRKRREKFEKISRHNKKNEATERRHTKQWRQVMRRNAQLISAYHREDNVIVLTTTDNIKSEVPLRSRKVA